MGFWSQFLAWLHPPAVKPAVIKPEPIMMQPTDNRAAFLTTIAISEGTQEIGDRGYNALFGGLTFTSYADHPRKTFFIPRLNIKTTAAGRYQILEHIYDYYKAILKLPDFSPDSQDKIALELIRECQALADVDAGYLSSAITKCSSRWASFAGNHYGQPTTPMGVLMAAFSKAGGKLA